MVKMKPEMYCEVLAENCKISLDEAEKFAHQYLPKARRRVKKKGGTIGGALTQIYKKKFT